MDYINKLYWKIRDWLIEEPKNPNSKWHHKEENFVAIGEDGQPILAGEDGYLPKDKRIVRVKHRTKAGILAELGLIGILALSGCDSDLEGKVKKKVEPVKIEEVEVGPVEKIELQHTKKISQNGIELIKKYEGFGEDIYKCPAGKDTIGYGHLIRKGEKYKTLSEKDAENLLYQDARFAEDAVHEHVNAPLTQNQYDALVSFVYNLGKGNFEKSALLKKLNSKDYKGAAEEFPKWNKAGGKVLKGLVNRRQSEKELFLRD